MKIEELIEKKEIEFTEKFTDGNRPVRHIQDFTVKFNRGIDPGEVQSFLHQAIAEAWKTGYQKGIDDAMNPDNWIFDATQTN